MARESRRKPPSYWQYKSFRDPLYGFIGVTKKELDIIQSVPFQRLRRLKQLSHAYLVYPSAMHVRFEHALGTLGVADRMCVSLSLPDYEREITRSAALTHDIGHGPFSHLFEEILKEINGESFSHEVVTEWILKDDPKISNALGSHKEDVLSLLPTYVGESKYPLLSEIVSSGLDADKLDYLRRDSYHVGVAYGSFDLERIIHTLSKTPNGESLCVWEKGKDATENYRLGRYLMHAQVYEHHARIAADSMFLRALDLAIRDGAIDRKALRVGTRKGAFVRADHSRFLKYYLTLDDSRIVQEISNAGGYAKKLLKDLYSRKLFKRAIDLNIALDHIDASIQKEVSDMGREEIKLLEKKVAEGAGCEADLVIAHKQEMTIKLYDRYDILVKRIDGEVLPLEDASPIAASTTPIVKLYVFCPKELMKKVGKATYQYLGVQPVRVRAHETSL